MTTGFWIHILTHSVHCVASQTHILTENHVHRQKHTAEHKHAYAIDWTYFDAQG